MLTVSVRPSTDQSDRCRPILGSGVTVGSEPCEFAARRAPGRRRIAGEMVTAVTEGQVRAGIGDGCKTVGSAYVGSNPTPATGITPVQTASRLAVHTGDGSGLGTVGSA
jgi:hypothetical protein